MEGKTPQVGRSWSPDCLILIPDSSQTASLSTPTEPFLAYHAGPSRKFALPHMAKMMVGPMAPREITVQAAAYRRMATIIEQAGLYKQVRIIRSTMDSHLITHCCGEVLNACIRNNSPINTTELSHLLWLLMVEP